MFRSRFVRSVLVSLVPLSFRWTELPAPLSKTITHRAEQPRSPFSDSTTSGGNERVFQFPPRFKGVIAAAEEKHLPSSSAPSPESPFHLPPEIALQRPPKKKSSTVGFLSPLPSSSELNQFQQQQQSSDVPQSTTHTSSSPPHSSNLHSSSASNADVEAKKATECHSAPAGDIVDR